MKKIFIPLILISFILTACGSTKDKMQGDWEDVNNEGYQLEVDDSAFEITHSGLTLKGKIEEKDNGDLKANFNGDEADVKYEDDKLIIDTMKFKKIE